MFSLCEITPGHVGAPASEYRAITFSRPLFTELSSQWRRVRVFFWCLAGVNGGRIAVPARPAQRPTWDGSAAAGAGPPPTPPLKQPTSQMCDQCAAISVDNAPPLNGRTEGLGHRRVVAQFH